MNTTPRTAIVTGATSGIGEATARQLVAAGHRVVGNGRTASRLDALRRELGDSFVGVPGDFAETEVRAALLATPQAVFGRPADLLVANAGRGLAGSVLTADLSEFAEVVRTNYIATVELLQPVAASMVELQRGSFPHTAADIVIIGSTVGRHVSPFSTVYGSTKFAIHGVAEGLRREVGPHGVRVTLIEPGIVVSNFQQVAGYTDEQVDNFHQKFGPLLTSDNVAEVILHAISLPPAVHMSDILLRPTRQDYP